MTIRHFSSAPASFLRRPRLVLAGLGTAFLLTVNPPVAQAADPVLDIGGRVKVILDLDGDHRRVGVRGDRRFAGHREARRSADRWDSPRPMVRKRMQNQSRRIHAGRADGSLTRGEARRLRRQQADIRDYARAIRSDGVVTPREASRLDRALDRQSRRIYRERHDRQTRYQRSLSGW